MLITTIEHTDQEDKKKRQTIELAFFGLIAFNYLTPRLKATISF